MKSFDFHRPRSVADAVAVLQSREAAKLLAGGQSLLPILKLDLAEPSDLVSLAAVPGLREIRADEAGADAGAGALVIGALVTHDEVSRSADVRRLIPGLAALAGGIGDAQIRNRGTLGGSLAHADPAADYPAAVVALNAAIVTDRRTIAADDFFTGFFSTALAADEIITAVRFPVPRAAAYAKFPHPASKYAMAGVMVVKAAGGVRVAVTGAGSKVFRLTALEQALGERFDAEAIDAMQAAGAAVVPRTALRHDGAADSDYLAQIVTVMARRAIQDCR